LPFSERHKIPVVLNANTLINLSYLWMKSCRIRLQTAADTKYEASHRPYLELADHHSYGKNGDERDMIYD
jgi:hypothetical protein